ncbi:MAG: nucleotidyltransferase domain-containing protein [Spirosomataceae bacterium]
MNTTTLISFLNQIHSELSNLQDDYYIIGSSAIVLAGIPLQAVDDIDILTSTRDADSLKSLWHNRKLNDYTPKDGDKFRSNFGRFIFEGFKVEVMGDLELNTDGIWQKVRVNDFLRIETEKISLKIPTIAEQIRILEAFGRSKDLAKVKLIQNHEAQ